MGGEGSKRKKIAMVSGAGAGLAGIAYVSMTANPAASAVLAFAACPAMCAAMGGAMWLSRKLKKRNNMVMAETSKNNSEESLASENHKVESQLGDDGGKKEEIVQVQYYQNQRKRKARHDNDGVGDITSA
jgi:iron only hydrogenase large subunit-like protein